MMSADQAKKRKLLVGVDPSAEADQSNPGKVLQCMAMVMRS